MSVYTACLHRAPANSLMQLFNPYTASTIQPHNIKNCCTPGSDLIGTPLGRQAAAQPCRQCKTNVSTREATKDLGTSHVASNTPESYDKLFRLATQHTQRRKPGSSAAGLQSLPLCWILCQQMHQVRTKMTPDAPIASSPSWSLAQPNCPLLLAPRCMGDASGFAPNILEAQEPGSSCERARHPLQAK